MILHNNEHNNETKTNYNSLTSYVLKINIPTRFSNSCLNKTQKILGNTPKKNTNCYI